MTIFLRLRESAASQVIEISCMRSPFLDSVVHTSTSTFNEPRWFCFRCLAARNVTLCSRRVKGTSAVWTWHHVVLTGLGYLRQIKRPNVLSFLLSLRDHACSFHGFPQLTALCPPRVFLTTISTGMPPSPPLYGPTTATTPA